MSIPLIQIQGSLLAGTLCSASFIHSFDHCLLVHVVLASWPTALLPVWYWLKSARDDGARQQTMFRSTLPDISADNKARNRGTWFVLYHYFIFLAGDYIMLTFLTWSMNKRVAYYLDSSGFIRNDLNGVSKLGKSIFFVILWKIHYVTT